MICVQIDFSFEFNLGLNLLFVLPVCICAKVLNWSKVELGKLSFGIVSTSYKSQSLLFASEEK